MIIAVDIGSSFLKLALLDTLSRSVTQLQSHPQRRIADTPAHIYEYSAEEMYVRLRDYISLQRTRHDIDGIIFATQMHGFLLRSLRTGRFTDYISWQDERSLCGCPDGGSYLSAMSDKIPDDIMRKSGVMIKSELALSGAYTYFKQNGVSDCGEWELFTLGSYMIHRLTGKNVTHITNACATGMYCPAEGMWNTSLLRALGMEGMKLPSVCGGISVLGEYEGIRVYPDVGDHQASVYGCLGERDALCVNIGTASQLSLVRDGFDWSYYEKIHEVRPYFGGRYVNTVSKLPGGRSVEVIARFLRQSAELVISTECGESAVWGLIDGYVPEDRPSLSVGLGFFRTLRSSEGYIRDITDENLTVQNLIAGMFYGMAEIFIAQSASFGSVKEIVVSGRFSNIIADCMDRLGCGAGISASEKKQPLFEGLLSLLEGKI